MQIRMVEGVTYEGRYYGAGPVTVWVGDKQVKCLAVMAGTEERILARPGALEWFMGEGLPIRLTEDLLRGVRERERARSA